MLFVNLVLGVLGLWLVWPDYRDWTDRHWQRYPRWQQKVGRVSALFLGVIASFFVGWAVLALVLVYGCVRYRTRKPPGTTNARAALEHDSITQRGLIEERAREPRAQRSHAQRSPASPRIARRVKYNAPGRPKASHGTWASFVYVDANGEVTEREVRNWVRTRQHIEGFCTQRRAVRTFRIDHVEQWLGHG